MMLTIPDRTVQPLGRHIANNINAFKNAPNHARNTIFRELATAWPLELTTSEDYAYSACADKPGVIFHFKM